MGEVLMERPEIVVETENGLGTDVDLGELVDEDQNDVERQRLEQELLSLSHSRDERLKSIEITRHSMFLASLPRIDDEYEMYSTQAIDDQVAVVRQRIAAMTSETNPETIG